MTSPKGQRTGIRSRKRALVSVAFAAMAAIASCEQQSAAPPEAGSSAFVQVHVQVASSLRDLLPILVAEYERLNPSVSVLPRYAGSQTLSRQIDAGAQTDAFISAFQEAVDLLITRPTTEATWIRNDIVVIAPADSDAVMDDLAMGDGPVALAADAVPLGTYTRLALRMADIWRPVESRSTQFTSAGAVLQQVVSGAFDLGIVYATDAALEPERVRIVGTLALPESVDVVYTLASFTPEGEAFVDWLQSPEALRVATDAGFSLPPDIDEQAPDDLEP